MLKFSKILFFNCGGSKAVCQNQAAVVSLKVHYFGEEIIYQKNLSQALFSALQELRTVMSRSEERLQPNLLSSGRADKNWDTAPHFRISTRYQMGRRHVKSFIPRQEMTKELFRIQQPRDVALKGCGRSKPGFLPPTSEQSIGALSVHSWHALFVFKNTISIHDIDQYIYSHSEYPTTFTWLSLEGKDKVTLLFHAASSKEMKPQPHLAPVILTAFRFGFKVSTSIWGAYWKLMDCLPPQTIKRNTESLTRARSSTAQIHFLEITGLNLPLETCH